MKEKDWRLKVRLEEELQIHPSYGSRRIATALGLCRQRAQRVMRLFGIKPYRRRGRKWRKSKVSRTYPNLLLAVMPAYANHIWAADFTEFVAARKEGLCGDRDRSLHPPDPGNPGYGEKGSRAHHSGAFQRSAPSSAPGSIPLRQRREYDAMAFTEILDGCGIVISRSRPGCPWENGYQESFYDKFKVDWEIRTASKHSGS